MATFRQLLEIAAAQQDFLWFCTLLAWLAGGSLLYLSWRAPLVARWRWWLALLVGSGLPLAMGELILHSQPLQQVVDPRIGWDAALHGLQTIQACATLVFLGGRSRLRPVALLLAGALGLVAVARLEHYVTGDLVLLAAGVALVFVVPGGRSWRNLGWLVALAPVLATTGIYSELVSQQRRWADLSIFALPSAGWQLAIAAVLFRQLARESPWARAHLGAREVRGFLRTTALWLAAGLALAAWTGRQARRSYEQSLLSRVAFAAATINPAKVAAIVGPSFHLTDFSTDRRLEGHERSQARSPFLVAAARPLRHELARLARLNPEIYWCFFETLRDGYLVIAAPAENLPGKRDLVYIQRRAEPRDLLTMADRQAFFTAPLVLEYGEIARAQAPLISADNRMLGWLVFEDSVATWAGVQAVARMQTFALTALGIVLAVFVGLQRLNRQERERAEREAAAALESDRAKTAFLAKVSHELRTPIQSILGYGELLAGQVLAPEPQRWLGAVRGQGQLLIRLVNDLIDLSALQAGAFRMSVQPGQLGELVRIATESLSVRAVTKGLQLTAEVGPDVPPWLMFDPERMRQLLLNLVGNAIKFTSRGSIRVRLEMDPVVPGSVRLSVRDTGPGIAPADQTRLFRPFSRLDQSDGIEGAGLGLALTAAICECLGGGLTVESDGVHGSTFTARLPLPPAAAPAPATTLPAAPIELAGLRVLVADDNPLVRELFATSLRRGGAWVEVAVDGLEAVELSAQTRFEAVVLDVSMPWLNGLEAARRIRAASSHPLRLIGVSAHVAGTDRQLALAAGMDVLLTKPVVISDLLAAVAGQSVTTRDPSTSAHDLRQLRRFRRQFAAEAPRLQAELKQALAASDRGWLRARVHYLKNSADVAGFPEISLLCAELERSAQDQTVEIGPPVDELLRLLRKSFPPFPPDIPSGGSTTNQE